MADPAGRRHPGPCRLPLFSMKVVTTEGIILRVSDYGETDQFILFFTRDYGKISMIAKHARKSRKRFGTLLQLFNLVSLKVRLRPQQTFGFLEKVRPLVSLEGIYADWRRITVACLFLDLVNEMTREGAVNRRIFQAVRNALLQLNQGMDWMGVLARFEYLLLEASGLGPRMDQCVVCHHPLKNEQSAYWVHSAGGMHCGSCLPAGVPFEVVKLQEQDDRATAILLYRFIRHHVGRSLRAWESMEKMGLLPQDPPSLANIRSGSL